MSVLVGRHALSEANNRDNYGTPLFGHPNASLMPEGRQQAQEMGGVFRETYDIDPAQTPLAVSRMTRSQETGSEAGFTNQTQYEALNEVDTKLDHPILKQLMAERRHTKVALRAAELILADPPQQKVWITHGLVVASLCEVLGIAHQFEKFVPGFCEIRELPI